MKRLALVGLVLALGAAWTGRPAGAEDEPRIGNRDIMVRLHKGQNPPLVILKKDLQADDVKWGEIQQLTKDFVTLGAALTRNNPPRGDKISWAHLTQQYYDNAKAMDDAAQRKDKQTCLAARNRLATSCTGCHRAHKNE